MEKFFNIIYRLRTIKRWNTSYCNVKESVAEHCFYVALIAELLYEIDLKNEVIDDKEVDLTTLLIHSLYHDSFESYSSHIVSPIRKVSYATNKGFDTMRTAYKNRILNLIPNDQNSLIKQSLIDVNEKIIKYTELADSLEAYIYSVFEIHSGNNDFINKKVLAENKINELSEKYYCIKVFLDNFFDENFEICY